MKGMSRRGGNVNKGIKTNSVGQGAKPRLKGNSSTTNVGKAGGKSSTKGADVTDKANFKRGDKRGGKASNFLTDSTKAHRSKDRLSKASTDLTYPIQKPLSRGGE